MDSLWSQAADSLPMCLLSLQIKDSLLFFTNSSVGQVDYIFKSKGYAWFEWSSFSIAEMCTLYKHDSIYYDQFLWRQKVRRSRFYRRLKCYIYGFPWSTLSHQYLWHRKARRLRTYGSLKCYIWPLVNNLILSWLKSVTPEGSSITTLTPYIGC
jgi:hypothetical protein